MIVWTFYFVRIHSPTDEHATLERSSGVLISSTSLRLCWLASLFILNLRLLETCVEAMVMLVFGFIMCFAARCLRGRMQSEATGNQASSPSEPSGEILG